MGSDSKFSDREWARIVATLVHRAESHEDQFEDVLRQLAVARDELRTTIADLAREIPNRIARQAAREVVQELSQSAAQQVTQSVERVLGPAEARMRNLLNALRDTTEAYRRAARDAIWWCIVIGCVSAVCVSVAMVFVMRSLGLR
jgi:uncharacterized protein YaaW (UPF0174 family)